MHEDEAVLTQPAQPAVDYLRSRIHEMVCFTDPAVEENRA